MPRAHRSISVRGDFDAGRAVGGVLAGRRATWGRRVTADGDLPRGTVHAHSTRSFDGRLSYAELRIFLESRRLRFACITEHIEKLTQDDIDRIVSECRAHSDSSFVFVPGIEMDCFFIYFLGLRPVTVDFTSNRTIWESLRRASRLCILSHPVKARFEYPEWLVDACDGVEILNTKHDGHHYFRRNSERLLGAIRQRRPSAIGLAGMDFHGPKDFSAIHLRLTRGGPLSEDLVLDCLVSGAFEIFKGDRPLAAIGRARRAIGRGRIAGMDMAHATHRLLSRAGFQVPSGIKRAIRAIMEGGT